MRFLVDNALSRMVAERLSAAGHDAVHVRDYNLQRASDSVILARAESEERIIVSADTDFGSLLALHYGTRPSVILFRRGVVQRRPDQQTTVLLASLDSIKDALLAGSLVILEGNRIRVRRLQLRGNGADI